MKKGIIISLLVTMILSSVACASESMANQSTGSIQMNPLEVSEQQKKMKHQINSIIEHKEGIRLRELAEIINKERPLTYDNYEYYRSHIKDTANRDVIKLYSEGIIQGDGKGYMRAERFLSDAEIEGILKRTKEPLSISRPTYVRRKKIPILAYHVIDVLPPNGSTGIYVHPDRFKEQLNAIMNSGYNTVTMEQVYGHWKEGKPLPEKPIVLSFDDGYDSHFAIAAKELNKRGMVGSFYIITSHVGDTLRVKPHQILEMYRDGMEIGSHTANHINAKTSSKDLVTEEYKRSKEDLEKILGVEIEHFCYPFGNATNHSLNTLKSLGFKTSVVTRDRKAINTQHMYKIERINVDYHDSISKILNKIK